MNNIKVIQDTVYSILVEFDRICQKYGFKYSLEGGTLLGAVKYGDFVPWDDDIDVIMLRKDYESFLKIANTELKTDFFLQSQKNIKDFPLNYAKLCKNNTFIKDYAYSHITDMHHGLFIDIFPIDNCLTRKARIQRKILGLLTSSRSRKLRLEHGDGWKTLIKALVALLPLDVLNPLIKATCTVFNGLKTKYRYEICNSTEHLDPLDASIYDEHIQMSFRGRQYLAVSRYDDFLKSRFGEKYMNTLPPPEKRKISHFHKIEIGGVKYEDQ